jgi:ATP synthase protein I
MSQSEPPDRLARLDERLKQARARDSGEPKPDSGNAALQQGMAAGLRIGVELVVAIVVATGLGWVIDRWAGTSPWVTIVMFFLGVAAGMVNVYRAVTGIKTVVGYRSPGAPEPGKGRAADKWDEDEE